MNSARNTISSINPDTPDIKPEDTTPSVDSVESESTLDLKRDSRRRKNGWNKRNMKLAREWLGRVRNMEKKYYQRVSADRIKSKILYTLCILFTATMSAVAGSNLNVYNCTDDFTINIIIFVVGVIATFLSTLHGYCNYQKHIENYKYSCDKFSFLARKIESVVDTANNQRPNAKEFLNKVSEKYYKYQAFGDQLIEEDLDFVDLKYKLEENKTKLNFDELDEGVKIEMPNGIDYSSIISKRLYILDGYMKKEMESKYKGSRKFWRRSANGNQRRPEANNNVYNGPTVTEETRDIAHVNFV